MRTHQILLLVVGLALAACDDPVGPATGTLWVSTYTEGGPPEQGYRLAVDEVDLLDLDPAGTAEVDLAPGRHTVRLVGAEQCTVTPGRSLDIDIVRGSTTPVAFEVSCPPTGDGTLVVSTSTGGDDADRDGYLLSIDDVDSLVLHSTGTAEVDLAPGRHTLRLLGVAEPCSVASATSLEVDVASQSTTRVAFEVSCPATGARVTVTTTGLDFDLNGYRLVVDGVDRGTILAATTVLVRLDPGSRTIALMDLAPNCAIDGSGSRTVTIVGKEVTPIEFAVVCTATSGVIGVTIEASGESVSGAYQALLDGTAFPVGLGVTNYLPAAAGDHVVSVVAPANCSVETDPQSVTVTAGGLTRDTADVGFSVTCTQQFSRIRITAPTTGPVPAGHRYEVIVCAKMVFNWPCSSILRGELAPKDTLIATYGIIEVRVELKNVPASCRVQTANPTRFFTVPANSIGDVRFPVVCGS